jgi:hypothetical protein
VALERGDWAKESHLLGAEQRLQES